MSRLRLIVILALVAGLAWSTIATPATAHTIRHRTTGEWSNNTRTWVGRINAPIQCTEHHRPYAQLRAKITTPNVSLRGFNVDLAGVTVHWSDHRTGLEEFATKAGTGWTWVTPTSAILDLAVGGKMRRNGPHRTQFNDAWATVELPNERSDGLILILAAGCRHDTEATA